jgi:hypothetical protein
MELIMTRTAVKDVAIYLRKSRDETDGLEDVLHKHESRLTEFAEKMQLIKT